MRSKHDVRQFKIDMPEARLEDPMARRERTRFPDDFRNDDLRYGFHTAHHRKRIDDRTNECGWRDVERRMNGSLSKYRVHDNGGHFAPLEVPEVYVEDVRTFILSHSSIAAQQIMSQ